MSRASGATRRVANRADIGKSNEPKISSKEGMEKLRQRCEVESSSVASEPEVAGDEY